MGFACRFIPLARVDRRVRPWVLSLALKNFGKFDKLEATKFWGPPVEGGPQKIRIKKREIVCRIFKIKCVKQGGYQQC
jgi:hypothetical protein